MESSSCFHSVIVGTILATLSWAIYSVLFAIYQSQRLRTFASDCRKKDCMVSNLKSMLCVSQLFIDDWRTDIDDQIVDVSM
jgi:hypothetical protein